MITVQNGKTCFFGDHFCLLSNIVLAGALGTVCLPGAIPVPKNKVILGVPSLSCVRAVCGRACVRVCACMRACVCVYVCMYVCMCDAHRGYLFIIRNKIHILSCNKIQ